ncbi:hypothetical protein QQP08_007885 [Theobroma cacao]|nr:hypothetical protein QQP08_007885 [Theobroma cacao]
MGIMENSPAAITLLLLRNMVTSIFIYADKSLLNLAKKYKLLELIRAVPMITPLSTPKTIATWLQPVGLATRELLVRFHSYYLALMIFLLAQENMKLVLQAIRSVEDGVWSRVGMGKGDVNRSGNLAQKLAARLLWLVQKLAACGFEEEVVERWASTSKMAWLSLSKLVLCYLKSVLFPASDELEFLVFP